MEIFYPKDRSGYVTNDALNDELERLAQSAVRSFPSAENEREAILLSLMHSNSVIEGAKERHANFINELINAGVLV